MKNLAKLLCGATALFGTYGLNSQLAFAQDNTSWTGVYAGFFAGAGQANFDGNVEAAVEEIYDPYITALDAIESTTIPTTTTVTVTDGNNGNYYYDDEDFSIDDENWLGGLRLGGDVNMGGFVVGVVGDIAATGFQATYEFGQSQSNPEMNELLLLYPGDATLDLQLETLATLRARLGIPLANFLLYGTAGLAAGNVSGELTAYPDYDELTGKDSQWMTGWTGGIGVAMQLASNIQLDVNFLHTELGESDFDFGDAGSAENVTVTVDAITGGIVFNF